MLDAAVLPLLACPACLGHPLTRDDEAAVLRCPACGRAFPLRRGIPDLLWGKNPPNEGPGDSEAMVRQRVELDRRLMASSPATTAYVGCALDHLGSHAAVLDIGTGPGTIPRLLAERASTPLSLVAFDKSWPALDAAQATLRGIQRVALLRASARRRFPLRSEVFGLVLRRLAPALPEEILRVLIPGGVLVSFTYGPRHWREAYDALPALPRPRSAPPAPDESEELLLRQGFAAAHVTMHEAREDVSVDDIVLALQANPAAYFFSPERDRPALQALAQARGATGTALRLTVQYELRVARKGA